MTSASGCRLLTPERPAGATQRLTALVQVLPRKKTRRDPNKHTYSEVDVRALALRRHGSGGTALAAAAEQRREQMNKP